METFLKITFAFILSIHSFLGEGRKITSLKSLLITKKVGKLLKRKEINSKVAKYIEKPSTGRKF